MFRFLSLFKRNRDEQLNDNDYDLNEMPTSVIDVDGAVYAQKPVLVDNALGATQNPPETSPVDTTGADQAGIERVREELSAITGNGTHSGEVDTSIVSPSPNDAEREPNAIEETPTTVLFSPDVNLIPEQGHPGEERPQIPIGVTRFQKGDKSLDWVSVDHSGNLQDPVHRTIVEAITTRNPQIVITEGHATYRGPDTNNSILDNREEIIDWTREQVEKVKSNDNLQDPETYIPEAGYAAYIAQEHGIPSIGGEPTGKELLDGMKARVNHMEPEGYPPEAVIADAFMRQVQRIPLEDRVTMIEEDFIRDHASELLAEANRRVDPLQTTSLTPLTIDQFRQWYALHPLSGNRRYIDVDYDDFTPRQDGGYSQVIRGVYEVYETQIKLILISAGCRRDSFYL